jgi:N-acetylmuramoyl-L-alanine amidase
MLAGLLIATIFSYWTPDDDFLPEGFQQKISVVDVTQAPGGPVRATPLPTEVPIQRIGIIAGHSGPPLDPSFEVDPGAVCDDNQDGIPELTELQINQAVADQVVTKLRQQGYLVDLLNEFDERLAGYRADVLVSIHTNDCTFYGFDISGYSVAGPAARGGGVPRGEDEDLVSCIRREYGTITGLPEHGALTEDMTSYHTFREISVDTAVAIIEIGFMYVDRQFLTQQPGVVADGIVSGILCYLEPLQPAPTPTAASADTIQ